MLVAGGRFQYTIYTYIHSYLLYVPTYIYIYKMVFFISNLKLDTMTGWFGKYNTLHYIHSSFLHSPH